MENTNNETKVVKAVRIEPVNYMSSKEEEIKTLEKIQKIALNGSFLAELFTDSLVSWAKTMIKSDNMPNLFDRFVNQTSEIAHYHQRVEEAERHVEEMRDIKNLKIEDLQNRLNQLSEKKDEEYRLVIENLKGEIKSMEDRLDIASSASIKYFQEREELSDIISQFSQKIQELNSQVIDRDVQIRTLKAMIFDLEHPEGK